MIGIHEVDAARSDVAGFKDPSRREFVLKGHVVLADQWGMQVLHDCILVEVRRLAGCEISPAGGEGSERRGGIGILVAEGSGPNATVVERSGIGFPLFQTVHKPVASRT